VRDRGNKKKRTGNPDRLNLNRAGNPVPVPEDTYSGDVHAEQDILGTITLKRHQFFNTKNGKGRSICRNTHFEDDGR